MPRLQMLIAVSGGSQDLGDGESHRGHRVAKGDDSSNAWPLISSGPLGNGPCMDNGISGAKGTEYSYEGC